MPTGLGTPSRMSRFSSHDCFHGKSHWAVPACQWSASKRCIRARLVTAAKENDPCFERGHCERDVAQPLLHPVRLLPAREAPAHRGAPGRAESARGSVTGVGASVSWGRNGRDRRGKHDSHSTVRPPPCRSAYHVLLRSEDRRSVRVKDDHPDRNGDDGMHGIGRRGHGRSAALVPSGLFRRR
ncbi:MAG: hypothetical protein QOF01_806 [Thermomicrobiales bacterium]|nr:hypothetical protein [Thermomicrobiales bacterium]